MAVVVDVEAAAVCAGAVVVQTEAAGAAVATEVAGVCVVDAAGVVVVVDGVVAGVAVSSRFLRPPSPRLLSARCSCSAVAAFAVAIAVSNFAISSAEAFVLFALSSSACMASICACNAAIAGSSFLVQPIAAPMISAHAIMGISLFVTIYSLY